MLVDKVRSGCVCPKAGGLCVDMCHGMSPLRQPLTRLRGAGPVLQVRPGLPDVPSGTSCQQPRQRAFLMMSAGSLVQMECVRRVYHSPK